MEWHSPLILFELSYDAQGGPHLHHVFPYYTHTRTRTHAHKIQSYDDNTRAYSDVFKYLVSGVCFSWLYAPKRPIPPPNFRLSHTAHANI